MTLENYKGEVLRLLRQYIRDEDYIKALYPDIEKSYKSCMRVKHLTHCDPDPSAYVMGIQFLYPELP